MSEFNELLTQWRRHLHQHPELALNEKQTSAFVAARLREMGLDVCEGVGKTGVVATLTAGTGGRTIGLRADMDAIVLQEETCLPYQSQNPGVMHGCGHDGHTATLLGAAKLLSETPNFNGTVRFVFQPGEEPGIGAKAMIEDGLFERFPMDEMYGAHNNPRYPIELADHALYPAARLRRLTLEHKRFPIPFHRRHGPIGQCRCPFSFRCSGYGPAVSALPG